jgi:hypothetical protein
MVITVVLTMLQISKSLLSILFSIKDCFSLARETNLENGLFQCRGIISLLKHEWFPQFLHDNSDRCHETTGWVA